MFSSLRARFAGRALARLRCFPAVWPARWPACSADDPASPAANEPRQPSLMAAAYAALEAADYAALPDLIAGLDAAFEANPDQGRLAFYAGTMRLWLTTGGPRELGERLNDVLGAIDKLEQARTLRPEDPHVGAFLGIAQVALGNVPARRAAHRYRTRSARRKRPALSALRQRRPHPGHGPAAARSPVLSGSDRRDARDFAACGLGGRAGRQNCAIAYPSAADAPQSTCWNGGQGRSRVGRESF